MPLVGKRDRSAAPLHASHGGILAPPHLQREEVHPRDPQVYRAASGAVLAH